MDRSKSISRRRILAAKALRQGLELSEDVLDYLSQRIKAASVRELEGALTRLKAMASLIGRGIDVKLAEETIGFNRATIGLVLAF